MDAFYTCIGGSHCNIYSVHFLQTYMFSQPVIIATEAKYEVTGLPDVDAISDVLEEEREALPSSQRCHVALGQSQMSGQRGEENTVAALMLNSNENESKQKNACMLYTRTSQSETAPPAEQ